MALITKITECVYTNINEISQTKETFPGAIYISVYFSGN